MTSKQNDSRRFWEQYDRAFNSCKVQAYALIRNGEPVGSVAIKYPRDGAGRLQAFVWVNYDNGDSHVDICRKGNANGYGYGYDKTSAAVESALGGTALQIKVGGADWKDALKEQHGIVAFATIRR